MKICLHDSDDAIGVDSDLHNRIYAKSSKALGHKDSSLDALDLPFFQLGKHPNQVHPAHVAVQALPSIPGPLALGDGRGAQPMDTPALQNADVDDDDDDDDDKALPASMNPIQLIHHAIPNMQKQRAEAKAKASAAKASAAKASSKSRGEKRKKGGGDPAEKDNAPQEKIMRLSTQKPGSGGDTGKPEVLESDADRKLLEDFRESMIGVKHSVLAGVGDGDAVVGENLKKAMKDISSLSKKLKEKRKSLKRRQDVGGPLKDELDNMIEELDKGYHISMKLSQSNGEENLLVDMKELVSSDWRISSAMFKRAFKCQALWCLKFSDWAKFTSMRQVMYSEMDGTNGEIFFECMTSELIQRLLRALPLRVSNKLQFSERFTVYLFFFGFG